MRSFTSVFLANIFLCLHYALVLYINSSYLEEFFNPKGVSLLFLCGALGSALLFFSIPRLLESFGLRLLFLLCLALMGFSILGLAYSATAAGIGIFFILYASVLFLTFYCLDIFLEDLSHDRKTGGIRGLYLTLGSAAIALGPLILTLLVKGDSLLPAYKFAGLLLIVPVIISLLSFTHKREIFKHGKHFERSFSLKDWWAAKDVRRVTISRIILEVFYTIMIIYTPIYLHSFLDFEWTEIGLIFSIMLLPFIILEWPAGEIADRWYGEKEIMSIGFIITAASLLFMPFIGKALAAWALILLLSRVGASLIEVSGESYFFKQITSENTSFIGIFRLSRAVAIVIGTIVGAVSLHFFPFQYIFLVLSVIVLFGLKMSLSIKDTK